MMSGKAILNVLIFYLTPLLFLFLSFQVSFETILNYAVLLLMTALCLLIIKKPEIMNRCFAFIILAEMCFVITAKGYVQVNQWIVSVLAAVLALLFISDKSLMTDVFKKTGKSSFDKTVLLAMTFLVVCFLMALVFSQDASFVYLSAIILFSTIYMVLTANATGQRHTRTAMVVVLVALSIGVVVGAFRTIDIYRKYKKAESKESVQKVLGENNLLKMGFIDNKLNEKMGDFLFIEKKYEEAIAYYKKVLMKLKKHAKDRFELYYKTCQAYTAMKMWDNSAEYLILSGRNLLGEENSIEEYFYTAKALLSKGDTGSAEVNYKKLLEKNHNNSTVHYKLGKIYLSQSRKKEMLEQFREALVDEPEFRRKNEIKYYLASALLDEGKVEEAKVVFEKIRKEEQNNPNALYNLKKIYYAGGDKDSVAEMDNLPRILYAYDMAEPFDDATAVHKKARIMWFSSMLSQEVFLEKGKYNIVVYCQSVTTIRKGEFKTAIPECDLILRIDGRKALNVLAKIGNGEDGAYETYACHLELTEGKHLVQIEHSNDFYDSATGKDKNLMVWKILFLRAGLGRI